MKLLFFWVLVAVHAYGQGTDSLIHSPKLLVLIDSLAGTAKNNLDTVSILKAYEKTNSDSIGRQQGLNDYSIRLNALESKLISQIDSLSQFSICDSLTFLHIRYLKSILDSVNNLSLPNRVAQALERVETLERKVSGKIDSVKSKINQKLSLLSRGEGDMPDVNKLPGTGLNGSLNIDSNLTALDGDVPGIEDPLENINAPEIGVNAIPGDLPKLPNIQLKEIKALHEVSKTQDKFVNVKEAGNEISGYQEELKELRQGDLGRMEKIPGVIESKVEDLDEVKSLQESSEEFAAIKARWNDPEVMKEQALNKAKEIAVNHFAGHEKELKAAMDKLARLKAKIPNPEGAIDLFAKRQKFMKGKPVAERFVPGLALQFQKQGSYWLDVNPYLGFKLSGRWLAGLGWNERLAYDFDEHGWDKESRIYGLRSFVHFKLKENLWLKADVENMNAPVHATPVTNSEIVGRERIWSFFAGMKKEVQLSRRFKANIQTLYNIYNPDKRSPYAQRLNIRIGFEMPMKKERISEKK